MVLHIIGLKGLPLVGCAPMFIREVKSLKAGENHMLHKLQVQFGPIYRLKMFGIVLYIADLSRM